MTNPFTGPLTGTPDKPALRGALETHVPRAFVTAPAANAEAASTTRAVIANGVVYTRDDADTTTPHDGLTCLWLSPSVRFKSNFIPKESIRAVKASTLTAPPGSPALGEAWLLIGAPTGAWAGWQERIAVWTARGWMSEIPVIGREVYSEGDGDFWHYTVAGDWVKGRAGTGAPENVTPWSIVVESVVSSPPGSPLDGQYYLIAAAGASGAFSGRENQIAKRVSGAWSYITGTEGCRTYDKAANKNRQLIDGAWLEPERPRIVAFPPRRTRAGSVAIGGGSYSPSWSSAPTIANLGGIALDFGSHTLLKAGNRLVFEVDVAVTMNSPGGALTAAIMVDSETTARAGMWRLGHLPENARAMPRFRFEFSPGDTLAHSFVLWMRGDATVEAPTVGQLLEVET